MSHLDCLVQIQVDSAEQTSFIVSFESDLPSASDLYEFDWDSDPAIDVLPGAQQTTTCTRLSASGRFVVNGTKDGKVGVRQIGSMCGVLQIALHDGVTGQSVEPRRHLTTSLFCRVAMMAISLFRGYCLMSSRKRQRWMNARGARRGWQKLPSRRH